MQPKNYFSVKIGVAHFCASPEDVTDVYDADDGDKKYVYGHWFV